MLEKSIRQELDEAELPFHGGTSKFCWHSEFLYRGKATKGLIEIARVDFGGRYLVH
jgi:hypothetical protein